MTHRNTVLPDRSGPDEARFHALLVAGLARVAGRIGMGSLADRMGRSTRALSNVFGGSAPEAKAMMDALKADPTALDELFAAYGFRLVPVHAAAANDLVTAAGVIDAMGKLIGALSDGQRDHNETLAVAQLLRPHIGAIEAIIREADELRGAA